MDIKPIKTEGDYRATLGEIESLMRAARIGPDNRVIGRLQAQIAHVQRVRK